MKNTNRLFHSLFVLCALVITLIVPSISRGGELSADDKKFLAGYEQIRAALAADDLAAAQKAAASLADAGADISKSSSLTEARAAFAKLSGQAIKLASGQPGFFILHCPMLDKDWVQTSPNVGNPYAGKEMLTCGELKK